MSSPIKYITDLGRLVSTTFQAIASNFKLGISKRLMRIFTSTHQIFTFYQAYRKKVSSEVTTW